jgi:ADP-ribosyl-[dinitrogen reductase] hydrolase
VAIRYWRDPEKLREVAGLQTRTTHAANRGDRSLGPFCGRGRRRDLRQGAITSACTRFGSFSPKIQSIASGASWRGHHRDEISGTGYVVDCLNAAFWAVSRMTNFRSAILLAANLGEDADTTAAVAGQLAGAMYGAKGIPAEWIAKLAWRERKDRQPTRCR